MRQVGGCSFRFETVIPAFRSCESRNIESTCTGGNNFYIKKKGKEEKFSEYHVDATIKIERTIFMVIEITVGPYRVADGIEKYFLRGYAHEQ